MTFNNIELLNNTYGYRAPNHQIYDGANIAIIHDGTQRHMIIKNIATAVTFIEPNANITETPFIVGGTSTRVFFANPDQKQLRSIANTGTIINEQIHNLNYFNIYRDIQYVGTNTTQNIFRPTCGNVFGETIVIGGTLENVSAGITIGGLTVPNNAICYMYSSNSGESFEGPFFPFLINGINQIDSGHCTGVLFINDNYYFVTLTTNGQNLNVVQSLGVDLIGDDVLNIGDLDNPANVNSYQLPLTFFDNKIFIGDTNRTGYYTFDLELDTITFTTLANITAFSIVENELRITTLDSCTPTAVAGVGNNGVNTITSFLLDGVEVELQVNVGKVLVEDTPTVNINPPLYNGVVNSDHFLQPASVVTQVI